jgi:phosphatidylglycerol:prolipoprotein diacylglycerol transferase
MTRGELWTLAGYLVAVVVWLGEARRRRTATEGMGLIALAALLGGVLGAKVAEWGFQHAGLWMMQPGAILDPRLGGRTILGGIVGGWLAVEGAKRYLGIRRSTGDGFALAVPAGEAIGRIGCFFDGCCHGTLCSAPWAVYQHEAWRHPAQWYLAAGAALNFAFFWWMRDRWPREGDAWKAYLLLGGATRFVLEFFRERSVGAFGFSTAQWTCLILMAAGLALLMRSRQTSRSALRHANA